jgi:hypothetical protein
MRGLGSGNPSLPWRGAGGAGYY